MERIGRVFLLIHHLVTVAAASTDHLFEVGRNYRSSTVTLGTSHSDYGLIPTQIPGTLRSFLRFGAQP